MNELQPSYDATFIQVINYRLLHIANSSNVTTVLQMIHSNYDFDTVNE